MHTLLYNIFVYSHLQYKCKGLISIVYGTVHNNRTVVVLLHRHFSSHLALSVILSALSRIVRKLPWANLTLWHLSSNHLPFSSWLITSNFSSALTVSQWFFTWIALGNVGLCFSLILVTTTSAVEGGITFAIWLYHQCSHSTYVTESGTVTSLSASLQKKTSVSRALCFHIALNQKLLHKFEKWCKFSSHI